MLDYSMLYPVTTVSRRVVSMDGMWKFILDEKSEGEEKGYVDGIPGSDMIPVPASFQDFYTEKDIREYAGDMWYEKDMFVPGEWEGKDVFVRFAAATHRAEVFVNGVKVAATFVMVDRKEKGKSEKSAMAEVEEEFGFPVYSVVDVYDIIEYLEEDPSNAENVARIRNYLAVNGAK